MFKKLIRPNIVKRFNSTNCSSNCKDQCSNVLNNINKNVGILTFITLANFTVPVIVTATLVIYEKIF